MVRKILDKSSLSHFLSLWMKKCTKSLCTISDEYCVDNPHTDDIIDILCYFAVIFATSSDINSGLFCVRYSYLY